MTTVYDFTANLLNGESTRLDRWRGRVLLIVNTASQCGYTPQYAGLEALYRTYKERGLTVLGFPCNQFGAQEPGSDAQIGAFCEKTYGVSFPLFARIAVNGPHAHPLFAYLCAQKPRMWGAEAIKWNFTKFLVDRGGEPVARYPSRTRPQELEAPIQKLL
jgi:glutathione peroxidase